ncbi:MAG: hypothetical protein HKN03_01565 [Acidimicrobiales bacterium]|nr:hypothetical protein [Acidimicrobiales bacterium]
MITPVIQEATEAPQPIIPPPSPKRTGRSPLVIALIVVGVILLPLILLFAGLVALRAGVETTVSEVVTQGEQFDMNRDMDMEMQVEVVLESGPTVVLPENVYPGEDRGVQEGSVQHVATFTSADGVSDLYRYQAILLDSATQEVMDCLGMTQGSGATVSCRSLDETQPLVFWGDAVGPSGSWYSVAVAGLPLEATRLVTETETGRLVGSDIVNGVSYQEWPAAEGSTGGLLPNGGRQFGEAMRTVALDVQGTVVWTEFGGN